MTASCYLEWVEDYLALRRGLGFDLQSPQWFLRDFARYADQVEHRGPITIDLAVRWALASRSSDPAQATRRLGAIRSFARHRAVFDSATEIPPPGLLGRAPRRKPPHIYSEAEIAALLRQAAHLLPRGGLRARTYVAFFSLLASTGLRLSEACALARGDIDLVRGVITVRRGKFRKARLVPLHSTATQALISYATYRDKFGEAAQCAFFFRTDRATSLTPAAVKKTFSRLRHRLGWTAHGRTRRPRIHDIRHTAVVRRLLRWYEAGVDIDRKILALSTYLGHAKVTDTYWYVSAIPELMAIASQRFEAFVERQQERAS
jgi:integrase